MVNIYQSGLLDYVKMHLTVHDELDFSVPKGDKRDRYIQELKNIMENALELKVPIIADASVGDNWADLEDWTPTTNGNR